MVVLEITKKELEGKKVNFIDVRTKLERDNGHINGDIHIQIDDLESKLNELDKNKESLVSSYDATWVSLTNVKLDVLGLRGVSVVDQTLKNIEITHPNFRIHSRKFITIAISLTRLHIFQKIVLQIAMFFIKNTFFTIKYKSLF